MQSCTVTPGDAGGKQQGVPFRPENARSSFDGCSSLSGFRPSSSCVFPPDVPLDGPTHSDESFLTMTRDDVPLPPDTFPTCPSKTDTTASNHRPDVNSFLSPTSTIPEKKSTDSNRGNAIHDDGNSMQSSSVHLHRSSAERWVSAIHTHVSDVHNKAGDDYGIPSSRGHARGKEAYGNSNNVRVISPSRQADDSRRRDGLLFFCSSDKYTNKADSSSTADNNDVADREESLQPRNFFPFNNLLAAAGWGSGGGWFFNNSGPFTTADSSDVTSGQAGTNTVVQAPGVVYLPQLPAMPPSRKVLPPLLSIGKVAGAQNNIPMEPNNMQQHETTVSRPAVDGTVLLASPWHQQERRHREQTCMKFKRRRLDGLAGGPLSTRSVALQKRASVSRLQHSAGTGGKGGSRISSICQLTKSVGNALWSCLCKLLRSRFPFVSNSAAAAAAASKAAKKIRRVPGVLRFFQDNAVGLALQDFSVRDVVRQWFSSLLLSEKQSGEKPVFLGPVRANACRRAAAGTPEEHARGENSFGSATSCSPTCAADAHVFITPEAARLLWRSACSLIVNPVTAMYFQCYRLASLGTVVYVTSVVHWWQPQLGIRRTLDVLAVCIVSGIHVIVACVHAAPPVLLLYMLLCCTGVVCYLLGCSLAFQGLHEEAAVCHVGLHSLCSIANLLLYYTIAG